MVASSRRCERRRLVLVLLASLAVQRSILGGPLYGGASTPVAKQDHSILTVSGWHASGLLLADPSGRRGGFDPVQQKKYAEIPNSHYDDNVGIDDDETGEPAKEIGKQIETIPCPSGVYTMTIWPEGNAAVDVDIRAADATQTKGATVALNSVAPPRRGSMTFTITFDSADISKFAVADPAAYSGSGASWLLTYASPHESKVHLMRAARSYPLSVLYDSTIDPKTFHAALNGKDISSIFHPRPGGGETVRLNGFRQGSNELVLSVEGRAASGPVRDEDRFTFLKE